MKKVIDVCAWLILGIASAAFVGPSTTWDGMGYCVLAIVVSGAWLCKEAIIYRWRRAFDDEFIFSICDIDPDADAVMLDREVQAYGGNSNHTGMYPHCNPYTRKLG